MYGWLVSYTWSTASLPKNAMYCVDVVRTDGRVRWELQPTEVQHPLQPVVGHTGHGSAAEVARVGGRVLLLPFTDRVVVHAYVWLARA
jgi:hypothetical protein